MELGWIGLGIIAFASTNVDDIFVLIGFLSQPQVRFRHVVAGQYAGLGLIIALSLAGSFAALIIPRDWIGLLGAVPVGMGLLRLGIRRGRRLRVRPPSSTAQAGDGVIPGTGLVERNLSPFSVPPLSALSGWRSAAAVAAVTISNGSDNVATYVPLFASAGPAVKELLVILFLTMIALWCMLGYLMVTHRRWGEQVRRYGDLLLPYILIGLGSLILIRSFCHPVR